MPGEPGLGVYRCLQTQMHPPPPLIALALAASARGCDPRLPSARDVPEGCLAAPGIPTFRTDSNFRHFPRLRHTQISVSTCFEKAFRSTQLEQACAALVLTRCVSCSGFLSLFRSRRGARPAANASCWYAERIRAAHKVPRFLERVRWGKLEICPCLPFSGCHAARADIPC